MRLRLGLLLVSVAACDPEPAPPGPADVVATEAPNETGRLRLPVGLARAEVRPPAFHELTCPAQIPWDARLPCVDGGTCDTVIVQSSCALIVGPSPVTCLTRQANGRWISCDVAIEAIEGVYPDDILDRIASVFDVEGPGFPMVAPAVAPCVSYDDAGVHRAVPSILEPHPAVLSPYGIFFEMSGFGHAACATRDQPFHWGDAAGHSRAWVRVDSDLPGCHAALDSLPASYTYVVDGDEERIEVDSFLVTAVASGELTDLLQTP